LENKTIEKINLNSNYLKIIKDNDFTPIVFLKMKESILKNKNLKVMGLNIFKDDSIDILKDDSIDILNNEYDLVYKLLNLTQFDLDLSFSNNIYFSSTNLNLKLNYLKCHLNEIDYLFFNFFQFDIIFNYFF
jgi:hypothetical protein